MAAVAYSLPFATADEMPWVPPTRGVSGAHLTAVPAARPAPVTAGRVRRHDAATYRRRRVAVLGTLTGVVLAGWVGLHGLVAGPTSPPFQPIAAHVVVVQPGDTLWSIAAATGTKGDIRPLVDRLQAELHGRTLQVGQRLLVP